MFLLELHDHILNGLHTLARGTGRGSTQVGVGTSAVPLTSSEWLRMETDDDTKVLSDPCKKETGKGEVITHVDTGARTNLVLPLRRHNLSVDSGDIYTSVETCTVVGLDQVTGKDLAGTDTTVVRTLWGRETAFRPAVRGAISVKKSVLLFDTEPRILVLGKVHGFLGVMTVVGLVRGTVAVVALSDNKDVVALAERIPEESGWAEVDVAVVARGSKGE